MILRHRKKALLAPLALVAVGLAIAAGCGDDDSASGDTSGGGGGDSTLTLVGYTTPREVYEEVIPAFQATPAGEGIDFEQSYGPSGDQSRAVEAGLDADVLALSLAPDIDPPGRARHRRRRTGTTGPTKGFVSNSVVVFAVRKGNPKNIQTWDDLVKDDVEVITPNPFTSGGAQWNIGAAYGAQLAQGKTKQEALEYLAAAVRERAGAAQGRPRVAAGLHGRQGRRAARLRERGDHGPAGRRGRRLRHPRPDHPDPEPDRRDRRQRQPRRPPRPSWTTRSPSRRRRSSPPRGTARCCPTVADANASTYPDPPGLFTIEKLGGWKAFKDEFFDPDEGVMADIFAGRGFSQEDE